MCKEYWIVYGCDHAKQNYVKECEAAKKFPKLEYCPSGRESGLESNPSLYRGPVCCSNICRLNTAAYTRAIDDLDRGGGIGVDEIIKRRDELSRMKQEALKVHEACRAHHEDVRQSRKSD